MIPQWWAEYVGGRAAPSFFDAVDDRFFDDPPSSMAARFAGDMDLVNRRLAPQARLVWQAGFLSNAYLAQCARADWQVTDQAVRWWAGDVLRAARKLGIPLYVDQASWSSFSLAHARYGRLLLPDEWQVIDWLARSSAPDLSLCVVAEGACTYLVQSDRVEPDPRYPLRLTPTKLARRS